MSRLVPVQLAAVTWNFPLVGTTRMLAEAWERAGQENWFVQVHSERSTLQRITGGGGIHKQRIVRPLTWPPRKIWRRLSDSQLETALRHSARRLRRDLDPHIDWENSCALVVTPAWEPWLAELPFGRVVYHCIDAWQVHSPPGLEKRFARWEKRLVDRADGGIVTAEILRQKLLAQRPDLSVELIPNGVAEKWVERPPSERRDPKSRPVIGFVGALYEWLDWELIEAVVGEMSGVDFRFIGPHRRRAELTRLDRHANVRFLGPCKHERVPEHVAGFDACWIPFRTNSMGRAMNPIKLYEYLALGKPVVVTEISGLEAFGKIVELARSASEMKAALSRAIELGESGCEERRAFAANNTWEHRASQSVHFLNELGRRNRKT